MLRILFVCLGNICRSPAAEGAFLRLVRKEGLEGSFEVDSAGTNGLHDGELPDSRMRHHAKQRGLALSSRSRQILVPQDLEKFDYIVVMDENNYQTVAALAESEEQLKKIHRMLDFAPGISRREVPDPYYGGAEGFEKVLDMVEEAAQGLLTHLKTKG